MTQNSAGNTGTRDVIYDLVSVLYHALQGAETYDQYIKDAQQRGTRIWSSSSMTPRKKSAGAQSEPNNCSHSI